MKLVRENIEFKRGRKNVAQAVGVGYTQEIRDLWKDVTQRQKELPSYNNTPQKDFAKKLLSIYKEMGLKSPFEMVWDGQYDSSPWAEDNMFGAIEISEYRTTLYGYYLDVLIEKNGEISTYLHDTRNPEYAASKIKYSDYKKLGNINDDPIGALKALEHELNTKKTNESVEFKRGGRSITSALGIGMYHGPWTEEKMEDIPTGFYIALAKLEKDGTIVNTIVEKIARRTWRMHTNWTEFVIQFKDPSGHLHWNPWFKMSNIIKLIPIPDDSIAVVMGDQWPELKQKYEKYAPSS